MPKYKPPFYLSTNHKNILGLIKLYPDLTSGELQRISGIEPFKFYRCLIELEENFRIYYKDKAKTKPLLTSSGDDDAAQLKLDDAKTA